MFSAKASVLQGGMMLLLAVGLNAHVLILPFLLQTAKRDAWISVLLAVVPVIVVMLLITAINRKIGGTSMTEWLNTQYGAVPAVLLKGMLSAFFLVNAYVTLYETTTWTKSTYLYQTPISATSITFMLLCGFALFLGIRPIVFTSGILLPIVVILGFYVSFVNIKYKDAHLLFPMLEHGWKPVLEGAVYACSGMLELVFILFLQPHLSGPFRSKSLLILAVIILGLSMGPLVAAIIEFNPNEAAMMRFPAYEEWRISGFSKYITQTDFLSIFQWISGAFARISFFLFVAVDVWNVKKKAKFLLYTLIVITFIILQWFPPSDLTFYYLLKQYVSPTKAVFELALPLLFAALVWLPSKQTRRLNS